MFSYRVLNYTKTKKKQQPPSNEIWYWAPEKLIIDSNWIPESLEGQGGLGEVNVVSHTFEKGKGIITCDKDIITITNNAFAESSITKVHLPEGLSIISNKAFDGCSNLEYVIFPKSITQVVDYSFRNCSKLKEIDLSDCKLLTTLNASTFSGCVLIESLNFSNCEKLNDLSNTGINNCSKIKKVNLKNCKKLRSIYDFLNNSSVSTVDLSNCNNLDYIQYSFCNDNNLKTISFKNCTSLSLILSSFNNCSQLKTIIFGKNKNLYILSSFLSCKISELKITPDLEISRIVNSFTNCSNLKTVNINCPTITDLSSSFSDGNIKTIILKDCIKLVTTYGLGGLSAFSGLNPIESLTLDNCGFSYFSRSAINSSKLKQFNLKNWKGLYSIQDTLFGNYSTLEVVNIENCKNICLYTNAFSNCTFLKSFNLKNSYITSVNYSTFYGCKSLREIDFTGLYELLKLSNNMFSGCTSLTKVKLNGCTNLDTVESNAFSNCTSLKKIEFDGCLKLGTLNGSMFDNSGIESISFKNCKSLSSIGYFLFSTLPKLKSLSFEGCISLSGFTFDNSYGNDYDFSNSLEKISFKNCRYLQNANGFHHLNKLKSVDFSGCVSLTTVSNMFNLCPNLQKIDFSDSPLLYIISNSFNECTKLKNIVIDKKKNSNFQIHSSFYGVPIEKLDFSNFKGLYLITSSFLSCPNLKYVDLSNSGNSMLSLNLPANFMNCSKLEYLNLSNTSDISSLGSCCNGNLTGKFSVNLEGSKLQSLGGAFSGTNCLYVNIKNCLNLSSISGAFNSCMNLLKANIENCLNLTGIYAFNNCDNLSELNISGCSNLLSISSAFNVGKLTNVNLKNLPQLQIQGSFQGLNLIESVDLNVKSIVGSFSQSDKLKNLYIYDSVNLINASFGNSNFDNITISENNEVYDLINNCVIEIETGKIVLECKNFTIPTEGDIIISDNSFFARMLLQSPNIIIPENVIQIVELHIVNNIIESIIVDENNQYYDSRNNCNAIIETETNTLILGCCNTVIPNDVTNIGNYAFYYCTDLTDITIPDSVTNINAYVFINCDNLTSVTISDSVTNIGDYAFRGCSNLTTITSLATTAPTIGSFIFQNVKENGTLYVPQGSTGYDTWMGTGSYSLGKYNWTKVELE